MIKSLRKKFILFAMTAVTVLLTALLLSINGLSWYLFERQADEVLTNLVNSNGEFMKGPPPRNKQQIYLPPELDIMRSARFFMVTTNLNGEVTASDINQVFYVTDEEAADFAKAVLAKSTPSGRIDQYRYMIKQTDDKNVIYFLDLTREQITIRTILFTSSLIAVVSWLIALIFVIIFSVNFVQPITAGLEKQKQFITNAGHELKTPLAIIQSNNDAMTLIHGENKYNRNIKSQVIRLGELTSNLLMQARLDEEVELQKELINISDLTNEIIQSYKDSADYHGITIISSIASNIMLNTNLQAYTQLLNVLMDNAMKYTTEKGEVCLNLTQDAKNVIINEENTCDPEMTIDPERLFERFYRTDNARTHDEHRSGYGIGLSVARSICEALGGTLTACYPNPGKICFIAKFQKNSIQQRTQK